MLVVLAGLPGTGKTTIARAVASRCRAAYIRVDAIEQAMRSASVLATPADAGPAGYALAEANLRLGLTAVADRVSPLPVTRPARRAVAAPGPIVEVEVVCSDAAEHRRRVETRVPDPPGSVPPTWESVLRHEHGPWMEPRLVLDTARLPAEQAAARVCEAVASCRA